MNPNEEKDVCTKGKSCGFACIDTSLECKSKLPESVSGALTTFMQNASTLLGQVRGFVSKPPPPKSEEAKVIAHGSYLLGKFPDIEANSSKLRELNAQIDKLSLSLLGKVPSDKRELIQKKLKDLHKQSLEMSTQIERDMVKLRREMLNNPPPNSEVKMLVGRVAIEGLPNPNQIRAHLEEFVKMFKGKGLDAPSGVTAPPVHYIALTPPGERAWAFTDKGEVFLTKNSKKEVLFHEVAHTVEAQNPWLFNFAAKWRNDRAFSEEKIRRDQWIGRDGKPVPIAGNLQSSSGNKIPVVQLNKLQRGYKNNEFVVIDNFLSPYMGKVYRGKGRNTEVISMAVEAFSSPKSMVILYLTHPDLFRVIAGLSK